MLPFILITLINLQVGVASGNKAVIVLPIKDSKKGENQKLNKIRIGIDNQKCG